MAAETSLFADQILRCASATQAAREVGARIEADRADLTTEQILCDPKYKSHLVAPRCGSRRGSGSKKTCHPLIVFG